MKKHFILAFALLLTCLFAQAQGLPQGINYQAVARDTKGALLGSKTIELKISLRADEAQGKRVYEETHRVVTNELGLFNLIVGEGQAVTGAFADVPWSEHHIWMEIALDEAGKGDYTAISASRLMAVPYAFHAGTADEVKGGGGSEKNAAFWKSNGNDLTVPGAHFLGTLDNKDVVFKTNNVERMRVGSSGDLNVNNNLTVGQDLDVNRDANIDRNLHVGQDVDIDRNLNVDGVSTLKGQVTVDANVTGVDGNYHAYPLRVQGGNQGIAIKVNANDPQRTTNFVTMFDGSGDVMGRIEGFQALEEVAGGIVDAIIGDEPGFDDVVGNSTDHDQAPSSIPSQMADFYGTNYGYGLISSSVDFVYTIVQFAINVIAAGGTLCLGGDCDDAVWSAINVIVEGIKLGSYVVSNEINKGIAFESGGADYAEWLPKADLKEGFTYGQVVGVKGGLISKEFTDAGKFMIISQNPTVIGAMPVEGSERMYEKIAFMGQVPVRVIGVAKRGDYILPSGNGDGMAIAVPAAKMKARDYGRIIGISWGEADGSKLFDLVNTAVGINANDMAQMVENLQIIVNQMQTALNQVNPNYQPYFFDVTGTVVAQAPSYSTAPTLGQIAGTGFNPSQYNNLQDAMKPVVQYATQQQFDFGKYPYLEDLFNNPSDVALAQKTLDHYTHVLHQLEDIMASVGKK